MTKFKKIAWRIATTLLGLSTLLGVIWYSVFALKSYDITPEQLAQAYAITTAVPKVTQTPLQQNSWDIQFESFDGAAVNGRLLVPDVAPASGKYPVLIALHGLGRGHLRWWQASVNDRPTLEQTDKITQLALDKGYAVIALDARMHGMRKDPAHSLRDLMFDLEVWGKREPYEAMIRDTVKDYRVLINWLDSQPQFDQQRTAATGYSMGGQMSLLLSALDDRIEQTLAIVPPHISQGMAMVSPANVITQLNGKVWLATANDDEYASQSDNLALFTQIATQDKQHIEFDGGHILPDEYYQQFSGWF